MFGHDAAGQNHEEHPHGGELASPRAHDSADEIEQLRKVCQHPYLSAPELEDEGLPDAEQRKQLINGCGKILFLKMLLPKLRQRGHRILLFSQVSPSSPGPG